MTIIQFPNSVNTEVNTVAPTFKRPMPIQIASEPFYNEVPEKKKNAAEPLKSAADIRRVMTYLIAKGKYRDNLIFIMGINFGLRCGDLLRMKIGHILNPDGSFKQVIRIEEEKTKKEENVEKGIKAKPGKIRTCYMNEAVMDAAELYLTSLKGQINLNDYLFKSMSNNNSATYYDTLKGKDRKVVNDVDSHIDTDTVERTLKKVINDELGINVHAGTHLLRKTFSYHLIMSAPDRSRAIEFLQKVLGHSSPAITLAYAGITNDEIRMTCQNLNLGAGSMDICYAAGLYFENEVG